MSAHRDPAETLFTDHLRALAAGRQPDAGEIERLLAHLERQLAREMRRSGIWRLPPRRLGVVGYRSWEEPGALRELAVDAYDEAVVRRLRGLFGQLAVLPTVDPLVATNVKRFLRDLQRRGDPLGHRVWQVAVNAAQVAVERQTLVVVADGPPVEAGTLLAVGRDAGGNPTGPAADDPAEDHGSGGLGAAAAEARRAVLAERAALWSSALLPELVTARGRAIDAVAERLADRLPELGAAGVGRFRLREAIAALRDDLRPRWQARLRAGAEMVPADEVRGGGGEEGPSLPALPLSTLAPDPETAAVERDAARRLARCVEERLATLEADERTRTEAGAVWRAHRVAAAEGDERVSVRGLAEALGIPRDRVPRLVEAVRGAFDGCRRELGLRRGDEEKR